jgi:hypothetical protein
MTRLLELRFLTISLAMPCSSQNLSIISCLSNRLIVKKEEEEEVKEERKKIGGKL